MGSKSRGVGVAVVSAVLLFSHLQLRADQWQFIKAFPDTSVTQGNTVHGLAVDPEGKLWVQFWNPMPGDSVQEANGIKTPVRAVYIFDKNGNNVSFSPITILTGAGIHDTLFVTPTNRAVTNRGLTRDHEGNILASVFDALYRIDYKTGMVLKKVQPFPNIALTAPAVDGDGDIVIGTVLPGNPLKIFDKDFNYLGNVTDVANGYSRSMAVSKDGKDVYYAGYTLHAVQWYHSTNGVLGPYVLADTILKGFDCESFARHPKTNYIWVSAGSGNDMPNRYPGVFTSWMPHTWYAYDPVGKQVVDTIMWMNVMDTYNTRPRAMAFSSAGDSVYLGSFGVPVSSYSWFPPVQKFVHVGTFEMKANIVVPDTVKLTNVFLGYSDTVTVSVLNNGKDILTVSNMTLDNPEFGIVGPTSFTLVQGLTKKVGVVVTPTSIGPIQATLTILSNAVDSVKRVRLVGTAAYAPKMVVRPDSLTVTLFEGKSTTRSMVMSNIGQGPLTWSITGSTSQGAMNWQNSLIIRQNSENVITDAEKYGVTDASKIKNRSAISLNSQTSFSAGTSGNILLWSSGANAPYFMTLKSTLEAAGFSVSQTGVRPIQPSGSYVAIFISEPDYSLSTTEISNLKNYVLAGGKIIDMTDSYFEYINQFLREFGVTRAYGGASGPVTSTHQIFQGVGDLTLDGGNWDNQLTVISPSIPIATCGGQIIASISTNNRLLVLGEDSQFSDFVNSLADPDNMHLLQNVIAWIKTGSSGAVTFSPTSGIVAPNDSQSVTITIDSKNLPAGDYRETFEIVNNEPQSNSKKFPVSIHVVSAPHLVVPDSVNTNRTTFVGVADTFVVPLKNSGSEHLVVLNITSNNTEFSVVGPTLFAVPSMTSKNLPVRFNPSSPGVKSATLSITSNDPDSTTLVKIVGTAAHPPKIVVQPDSFSVALNVGDSSTVQMTIDNSAGLGPLTFKVSDREETPLSGTVARSSGYPFARSQGKSFGVSKFLMSLSEKMGAHREPEAAIGYFSQSSAASTTLPLLIKDPIGDGGTVDIAEIHGSSAGGNLQMSFVFSPSTKVDSALGVLALDIDQRRTTGQVDTATYHDVGSEYYIYFFKPIFGDSVVVVDSFFNIIKRSPLIIQNQEASFSVPLSILGGDDGRMDFVAVSGNISFVTDWAPDKGHATILPDAAWLASVPDSGSVPPGGSTQVSLKVKTKDMFGGKFKAVVTVSSNDPLKPRVEKPFRLTLTGIPKISLSKDSLNFGQVYNGFKKRLDLVITNTGTDLLTGTVQLQDSVFFALDSSYSVAPTMSTSIRIEFRPRVTGHSTKTFTILSNTTTSPLTVSLLGDALVAPNIKTSVTSFTQSLKGSDTLKTSFKIINTGEAPLTVKVSDEFVSGSGSGAGVIYAAHGSSIYVVDLKTRSITATLPSPVMSQGPTGLAYSGKELFIEDVYSAPFIYVLDPSTGAVLRSFPVPTGSVDGLAYVNDKLYALGYNTNSIFVLNPQNGARIDSLYAPVPIGGGMDGANGRLFVTSFTQVLYELNPQNASVIRAFSLQKQYYGVAFTGTRLFVSSGVTDSIATGDVVELDPQTGAVVGSFFIGNSYALAGGGPGDAPWLTETPSDLTVQGKDSTVVQVTIIPKQLTVGQFKANIVLSSNDPDSAKATILVTLSVTSGVGREELLPTEFALYQNYPNPFNPTTTFKFGIPEASKVSLKIYDVLGREASTIVDKDLPPGYYAIPFNGANLSSGAYFYRIIATRTRDQSQTFVETKKLLIMK